MEDYKLERCREPLQLGLRVKMNNIIFFFAIKKFY